MQRKPKRLRTVVGKMKELPNRPTTKYDSEIQNVGEEGKKHYRFDAKVAITIAVRS